MIIYKATNKINGKVYIGQTIKTLSERIKSHKSHSKTRKSIFYSAIIKYGFEIFEWKIIDFAKTHKELDNQEKYYIKLYDSMNIEKGYNMTEGGDHCILYGEKNGFIRD
jgi:group I intron endonuclease